MGQLNIKDEGLIAEAKELAALLGTSTTNAVRQAVRERLERERKARERWRKREELAAIVAEVAPLLAGPDADYDHDRLLYDPKTGLPA
jgi:antitoxin VapB